MYNYLFLHVIFCSSLLHSPKPSPAERTRFFHVRKLGSDIWGLEALSNRGAYCNGGFVITGEGVVMVDAFARPEAARDAIRIVRSKTAKKIRFVVLTHHHFDHVDGATAFPRDVVFVTHANVRAKLIRRDSRWSRVLMKRYEHGLNLVAGQKRILLLHMGAGHTDADTFVYIPENGVLFTGDMVTHKDAGYFGQAHVFSWIQTLELLRIFPIHTVVPGHGPIGERAVFDDFISYLRHLYQSVKALKDQGLSDRRVQKIFRVGMPYASWSNASSRTPAAVRRILAEIRMRRLRSRRPGHDRGIAP